MSEEKTKNDDINNNNTSKDEEMEEEVNLIPEISGCEEFALENNFKEDKEKNDTNKEREKKNEIIDDISLKNSLNDNIEEIKTDNNNNDNINGNTNNSKDIKDAPMINNFFLTTISPEQKENKESKEEKTKNEFAGDDKILENDKKNLENDGEEEDEFNEIDEIEQISGFEDEDMMDKLKEGENHQTNSDRLLGIKPTLKKIDTLKEENEDNNSFHSFSSSSLNENIGKKIEDIMDIDNKESSFMKQMLVETNKHYIKEQRQQSEKLQEWGLKVIVNIILSNKNRIVENAFYIIKYNRISLTKNREKILIKYYQKYRNKMKKEFLKKYFMKFKIKAIELKPREERIFDLIKVLDINNNNIEILEKIEK
jgi:hypothetical protein